MRHLPLPCRRCMRGDDVDRLRRGILVSSQLGARSPSPAAAPGPAAELTGKDAAAVVGWLKTNGVPVTVTNVYDESSDPNSPLGRPGGYTSKDAHVPVAKYGSDTGDPDRGGSVDVFSAQPAAAARDIQSKLKAYGLGAEYDYVVGGILVRVTGSVPPSQPAVYAKVLGVQAQPA